MKLRNIGFRGISMHAPSKVGDLSSPDESQRQETILACQKALDAAMLMGANLVTFHPASIEGEMGEAPERWVSLCETLQDLSGYAEDRDIKIAIENFPVPLFGCYPRELYQRIAALGIPNVGMCLDIGHAYVGGDLPALLSDVGDKVFAVHASDNRGRVDEHLPPGQGSVPWEVIITGLRQLDFRGPFVMEVRDGRRIEHILDDIVDFAEEMGLSGVGQLSR
jgi:sugar phosphate isomerase/epimerase